ncbi:MAG: hypothetical protein ACU0CI_01170 [Shimia sp.]
MKRALPLMLVALIALSLAMALLWRANPLTDRAQAYAQEVAAAAAGTYITLRTLNAVLSTAQEVEVGGAFFVQGSAQPLKALEPIDDTIERIAGFVFLLMVATGILAVALGPVGSVGWAMVALACALALARPTGRLGDLGARLGWYGAFLALAVPVAFVLTSLVAERLTRDTWAEHSAIVAEITAEVGGPMEEEGGLRGALRDADRYRQLAGRIFAQADVLIASYVSLLAVFVFRVFLLPAAILGAFLILTRWMAAPR